MTTESTHSEAEPEITLRQWIGIIGGLIGGFMAVLDIQVTNSSMNVIQGALAASLDQSSWLQTSYFTAEIVAIPLSGWLARSLGTGRYSIICSATFVLASLLCSSAGNLNEMIVYRALQGFAGGGLIPISYRLILEILPPRKQPVGMAMFSVLATFAPAVGPSLGGFLTDNLSWHYIFYINVLPGIVSIICIAYGITLTPIRLEVLKKIDVWGVLTIVTFLFCTEIVLEEGRRLQWFSSPLIMTLSIIAVFAFLGFLLAELSNEMPLVNLWLLRDYAFQSGAILFIFLGIAIYGTLFLVPYYLIMVQKYDATQVGHVLIWMGLPQLVFLPLIPYLVRRINPKYLMCFGFLGMALSSLMNSHMSLDYAGAQMRWSLLVRALSQPFIMVPLSITATRHVQRQDGPSSAILVNIFRNLGGSFGTALLTTWFSSVAWMKGVQYGERVNHTTGGAYDSFINDVAGMASHVGGAVSSNTKALAFGILQSRITQQAEVMAFNYMFYVMGALMLVAAVIALASSSSFQFLRQDS